MFAAPASRPGSLSSLPLGAPAGGLAGPVANTAENAREHVRLPVHHVGIGEPPLGDQADVLGDIGVGRAGPLAIHYSMVIVGMRGISRFHSVSASSAQPPP